MRFQVLAPAVLREMKKLSKVIAKHAERHKELLEKYWQETDFKEGDVRQIDVVDFTIAQSFDDELGVEFEGGEVDHLCSSPGAPCWRPRRYEHGLLQPANRFQDVAVQFD